MRLSPTEGGYGTIDHGGQQLNDREPARGRGPAPRHGFAEAQEARFAREALDCTQVGLSLQRVKPDRRQAFGHSHGEDG
jgi:hypothetical protein